MGAYSYKDVCYRDEIQAYVSAFEEKHGREFDDDPNYSGDYWIVASDYIDDLEAARDEAVNALRLL